MTKLIALDIDGTIARHNHISKNVVKALTDAQSKGITVTVATGRNTKLVKSVAKKLNLNNGLTPMIGLNGAEVFTMDKKGNTVMDYQEVFGTDIANKIIEEAIKEKISLYAYTTDNKIAFKLGNNIWFFLYMFFRTRVIPKRIKKDLSNIKDQPIIKFLTFGSKKKIAKFKESLKDLNLSTFSWSFGNDTMGNIEINKPGVNKVEGLKFICNKLGIEAQDVVYFGDGDNDIASLEWAGTGVVMQNAKSNVKQYGNDFAFSVKQDGVADWINRNVK